MSIRGIHRSTPKPAVSFFDLEVLFNLILQALNIFERIRQIFFGV